MCASEYSLGRNRLAACLAALTVLSGCAVQKGVDLPELNGWDGRRAILGELDKWRFSGRIAVRTSDDGFNGKLRWHQDDEHFVATVSGPLGIGTVQIEGNAQAVRITDKDGETTALHDIETELLVRYGWTIPVESLRFWVLGIPDPRVEAETRVTDEGRLQSLTQRGWDVEVSRYREAGGQQMPSRLAAKSAATSVRLVIDRWTFL
jgi:outer membrane lipoprotein LolB